MCSIQPGEELRLLLIEDHEDLAEVIVESFRAAGDVIDVQVNGLKAEVLLRYHRFDLIILDINLPGMQGDRLLKMLRGRGDDTPILVLTARSAVGDRIDALDTGADDYLTKPFDLGELQARCRALQRRHQGRSSNIYSVGTLRFDRSARRVWLDGQDLELRQRELQVLEALIDNAERVVSKEQLMNIIYRFDESPSSNAIEQIVTRLRRKLGVQEAPVTIRTIRGLGYVLSVRKA